ncbi:MAG: cyclic nucleotide-binding domain-containing protein [Myxococcota bacterium]|nr:cyclic nucleotide-binding domain-containing protein [Myxococcota bacterium]
MVHDPWVTDAEKLGALYLFREVPKAELRKLCILAPPTRLSAGSVLFEQGESANIAMLLVEGRLEVSVQSGDQRRRVGDVRPGEIVGELALFSRGGQRSASVEAAEASKCLLLSWELLEKASRNQAIIALEAHLLGTMARRIRSTNTVIQTAWKDSGPENAEKNESGSVLDRLRSLLRGAS